MTDRRSEARDHADKQDWVADFAVTKHEHDVAAILRTGAELLRELAKGSARSSCR